MFSKASKGLVWWPVEFEQYDEAGTDSKVKLMLLLRPFARKELQARQTAALQRGVEAARKLQEHAIAGALAEGASVEQIAAASTDRLLQQVLARFAAEDADVEELAKRTHDWRGVKEGDDAVPFSREHYRDLLEEAWFYKRVAEAFEACSAGAVRKNSQPGPAGVQGLVQS
jgi:hypothetical protein